MSDTEQLDCKWHQPQIGQWVRDDGLEVRHVGFDAGIPAWRIEHDRFNALRPFVEPGSAMDYADRFVPDRRTIDAPAEWTPPPADEAPTRASVLDTAKGYVTNDRQSSYGDCEDNFANIAALWSTYLRTEVKPADVATMMVLLKTARLMSSPGHTDNWIDIAGYAACGGEITGKKE